MTAPEQPAGQPSPDNTNVDIEMDIDDPAKPRVVLKFTTGETVFVIKLDARGAAPFGAQLGQGIIQTAQAALAKVGPQLITPNGAAGRLFLPNGVTPR